MNQKNFSLEYEIDKDTYYFCDNTALNFSLFTMS